MDIQVRCGFCGATNLSSAFSCSECFMPLVDDVGISEGPEGVVDAFVPADDAPPAPPPARRAPLGPYRGPKATAGTAVEPAPGIAPEPEASAAGILLPGYRIGGNVIAGADAVAAHAPLRMPVDPNRVAWRWYHLIGLALLVWGVPMAVDWGLG
ncbi:MAG TPA: hypothetical protein VIG64_14570, partial [Actinomycetota bacterium]